MDVYVLKYDTSSHSPGSYCAQRWWFFLKLESSFGRKDTVLFRRGWDMLSESLPNIFISLNEVMKHSNSNGYISQAHLRNHNYGPTLGYKVGLVLVCDVMHCFSPFTKTWWCYRMSTQHDLYNFIATDAILELTATCMSIQLKLVNV